MNEFIMVHVEGLPRFINVSHIEAVTETSSGSCEIWFDVAGEYLAADESFPIVAEMLREARHDERAELSEISNILHEMKIELECIARRE